MSDHVLLVRVQDLLLDLLPRTGRWPKRLRYSLTGRLEGTLVDLACSLAAADALRGRARRARLMEADGLLAGARMLLRVAHDLGFVSAGGYAHLGRQVEEIGRLLGGWLRAERGRPDAPFPANRRVSPGIRPSCDRRALPRGLGS